MHPNTSKRPGIAKFKKRNVTRYLVGLIKNYINERKIVVGKSEAVEMTCVVPQGSVLAPVVMEHDYGDVFRI